MSWCLYRVQPHFSFFFSFLLFNLEGKREFVTHHKSHEKKANMTHRRTACSNQGRIDKGRVSRGKARKKQGKAADGILDKRTEKTTL